MQDAGCRERLATDRGTPCHPYFQDISCSSGSSPGSSTSVSHGAMQLSKLLLCLSSAATARSADLLCQECKGRQESFGNASCKYSQLSAVDVSFAASAAQDAEPQAPRDVSPGYVGERITRRDVQRWKGVWNRFWATGCVQVRALRRGSG